jgi:RNA polymerase sigma factor (sigma-70 family)
VPDAAGANVSDVRPQPDLDAWIMATAPRAVAYARSLVRDAHAAEDIVQDCYCRLLAKQTTYDLPRDGLKLLMRSITNACINHQTRRRPWFRLVRTDDGDAMDDPADPHAFPAEASLRLAELSAAVSDALAKLPKLQRAAIELKSLGHTQQEIAEILDITATHAGVLIHRARQTLSLALAAFLPGEVPT